MDAAEQQCLESVQTSFDPLLDLLTTHSRTPGVQESLERLVPREPGLLRPEEDLSHRDVPRDLCALGDGGTMG